MLGTTTMWLWAERHSQGHYNSMLFLVSHIAIIVYDSMQKSGLPTITILLS